MAERRFGAAIPNGQILTRLLQKTDWERSSSILQICANLRSENHGGTQIYADLRDWRRFRGAGPKARVRRSSFATVCDKFGDGWTETVWSFKISMMRAWTAIACVAFFTGLPGVPASEVVASPPVNGEWIVESKEEGAARISVRFEKRWVVISIDGKEQVRGLFQIVGRREDGAVKVLVAGEKWAGSEPAPVVVEDPFDPFPGRTHFVMKDLGDDRCAVIFCDGLDWRPREGIPDVTYRRPTSKP